MRKLLLTLTLFLLTSCATILGPSRYSIPVETLPNAKIDASGSTSYAPSPALVKPASVAQFTISKRCYVPKTITLHGDIRAGALVMNILFFWPGILIDALTGNMWSLPQATVNVELEKDIESPLCKK